MANRIIKDNANWFAWYPVCAYCTTDDAYADKRGHYDTEWVWLRRVRKVKDWNIFGFATWYVLPADRYTRAERISRKNAKGLRNGKRSPMG